MAKYEIKHICGHTETIALFGKHESRYARIEYLEKQECLECRRKREAEEAEKIGAGLELPELSGSEKQVAWANTIRAKVVQFIKDHTKPETMMESEAFQTVIKIKTARYFIDHRDESPLVFLSNYYNTQVAQAKACENLGRK